MAKGKTGSIRQEALSVADLNAAENHGKRLDKMGQSRRVRDVEPLVYGSLDLAEKRKKWMEGVKQQGKTAALHMLVQYPTALTAANDEVHQKALMRHAVRFANEYHGGDAVFAARLDRDEKGQHTVDVFLMPRHDFHYKDGRTQKRASVSKFSKEHAKERYGSDDPWSQGSALQDAWFEYLQRAGLRGVEPPTRKATRTADRLEPEAYALRQDKAAHEAKEAQLANEVSRFIRAAKDIAPRVKAVEKREKAADKREAALSSRESDLDIREMSVEFEEKSIEAREKRLIPKEKAVEEQLEFLASCGLLEQAQSGWEAQQAAKRRKKNRGYER